MEWNRGRDKALGESPKATPRIRPWNLTSILLNNKQSGSHKNDSRISGVSQDEGRTQGQP